MYYKAGVYNNYACLLKREFILYIHTLKNIYLHIIISQQFVIYLN